MPAMASVGRALGAAALLSSTPALCAVLDLPIHIRNTYAAVEVLAGTPPVSHMLHFDTGSATTWMIDPRCGRECSNYSGYSRTPYNSNTSTTHTLLGTWTRIDYLGGSINGVSVQDTFNWPTSPATSHGTSPSYPQTFLSVDASTWSSMPTDGFLGLSFGKFASSPDTTTVFETLMGQQALDRPRFAVYWGRETRDTNGTAGVGRLTLGDSAEDTYVAGGADAMSWVDIEINTLVPDPKGGYVMWDTAIAGAEGKVTRPDGTAHATPISGVGAEESVVFDTGGGNILVPPDHVSALYASIGMNYTALMSGAWLPPCSDFNSSWSVTFMLGRGDGVRNLTLTGDQLRRPGFAYQAKYCFPPFDNSGGDGFWLMGARLMRQVYMVYDYGSFDLQNLSPRIGWGHLKEEWKPDNETW